MTYKLSGSALALALAGAVATPAVAQEATELPPVAVTSDGNGDSGATSSPSTTRMERPQINTATARTSDTASLLKEAPGVSLFGAGGYSSLPVVRGLDNERIAIRVDGETISNACPNNMNPALSYTDPQTVQAIEVHGGITPVSFGGDSIGATIRVETLAPKFAGSDKQIASGRVTGFYRSNGDGYGGALSFNAASGKVALSYNGSYTQSDNYNGGGEDGVVRSSLFAKTDHSLGLAYNAGSGVIELKAGIQYAPYEGFPNQWMDMVENRSWFAQARYRGFYDWGEIEWRASYRDTDHKMDLLADKAGTMPMVTETHTAASGIDAKLFVSGRDMLKLGADYQHLWLDDYWPPVAGSMMMSPNTYVNINGGTRNRLGLYAEWEADWSGALKTIIGVRNDQLWMNTGKVAPYGSNMMNMPDMMAAAVFNAADRKRHDSNWSGSAILRHDAGAGLAFELGAARKVRSPNLYERYSWGRGSMASRMIGWYGDGNGYVGNIGLKPERADLVSAAVRFYGKGGWHLSLSPYYTRVHDYIDAVKLADFTMPPGFVQLQFANREARFYGVDASGHLPLWNNEKAGKADLTLTGSWVRGTNLSDKDPLYHQMPLNGKAVLTHRLGGWDNRVELEAVGAKTRVDPTRKERSTQDYLLVNLATGYRLGAAHIGVEVSNLFDTAYTPPLGGFSIGDFRASKMAVRRGVPGRGRSFNLQIGFDL